MFTNEDGSLSSVSSGSVVELISKNESATTRTPKTYGKKNTKNNNAPSSFPAVVPGHCVQNGKKMEPLPLNGATIVKPQSIDIFVSLNRKYECNNNKYIYSVLVKDTILKKRRVVIDLLKVIPPLEFKRQLKDSSDTTLSLVDYAPPTKKAMHYSTYGGVGKFFAYPGLANLSCFLQMHTIFLLISCFF